MDTPVACNNGTYSNTTASTECKICPATYSCGDPQLTPQLCLDGYYSSDGALYCLECPTGYRYILLHHLSLKDIYV